MLIPVDLKEDYGEERWIGIGFLRGRIVVVVFTEHGDDTIRIISLRKVLKYERIQFERTLQN